MISHCTQRCHPRRASCRQVNATDNVRCIVRVPVALFIHHFPEMDFVKCLYGRVPPEIASKIMSYISVHGATVERLLQQRMCIRRTPDDRRNFCIVCKKHPHLFMPFGTTRSVFVNTIAYRVPLCVVCHDCCEREVQTRAYRLEDGSRVFRRTERFVSGDRHVYLNLNSIGFLRPFSPF